MILGVTAKVPYIYESVFDTKKPSINEGFIS